jgi:beta-xylosidase
MDQGTTNINGPHQGAWVQTQTGEDWFLHFQDKESYGRVLHLQPMKWVNDWPVIGIDKDSDGKGEPILVYKKPNVGKIYPIITPAESDEFNDTKLGPQWQWQANPKEGWAFLNSSKGSLRMNSVLLSDSLKNLWSTPNLLMQKFPADVYAVYTKFKFSPKLIGEKTGLIVFGEDYGYISITKKQDGNYVSFSSCTKADKGSPEQEGENYKVEGDEIYFQVIVVPEMGNKIMVAFGFRTNDIMYKILGKINAKPGRWVGTKVGLFCTRTVKTNDSGFADIDWFRIEPLK